MSCRHLTKAGAPCKGARQDFHIACDRHATADDREMNYLLSEVHMAAWKAGYEVGEAAGRQHAEWALRSAQREEQESKAFRTHDGTGQLVMVGKYTYRWRGEPLEVGDLVELPEGLFPGTWRGAVTALGSSYVGPIKDIIRKRAAA